MLCDLSRLTTCSIILASGSPRRQELLGQLLPRWVTFEVIKSDFAEDLPKGDDAARYVRETALMKGRDVLSRVPKPESSLVISADTVVVLDGVVLEKPADAADACAMLRSMAGRRHQVLTGCALFFDGRERSFHESTAVDFAPLTEETIRAYVDTGDPMDKAGAYGIQGRAGAFVLGIQGCYYNVVGLPMNRLSREILDFLPGDK